jgi:hypothetical protein
MSDYFLNKIYDSLLSKKPVPKKPEPIVEKKEVKPTTLQQAYYRIQIEQINEETDILMQQRPDGNVEQFEVTDELANKIKKSIRRETKVEGSSVNEALNTVLTEKGWKENNPSFESVLQQVINAFDSGDINPSKIVNYSKLAAQTNNPLYNKVIQSPNTVQSLQEIIPDWFNNFFTDNSGINIASKIWDIDFAAKGGTKVGKLELLCTMISHSNKGDVGDLMFPGYGEVEVKGSDARMGGDAFAPKNTPVELNRILQSTGQTNEKLFDRISARLKNDINSRIDKVIASRQRVRGAEAEIKHFSKIKQDIKEAENFDQIVTDLETLIKTSSYLPGSRQFIQNIKKIINSILKYTKHIKQEVKGEYLQAVSTFFSLYKELTDDQLIDGIVATRNYTVEGAVPALRAVITNFVVKEKQNLFTESGLTASMKYLIAAIHLTVYYYVQKFKGILFANDKTRKVVYLEISQSSSLEEVLINSYNFLKTYNATINLSLDKRSASAGIELKI